MERIMVGTRAEGVVTTRCAPPARSSAARGTSRWKRKEHDTRRLVPSSSKNGDVSFVDEEAYREIRQKLLSRTASVSLLGTAYCLFGFGKAVAGSYALGTAGAALYVMQLCRDVETYSEEKVRGFRKGDASIGKIERALLRTWEGSKLALGNGRLFIPVALSMMYAAWNRLDLGEDMSGAGLLVGFLTYKVGFFLQLWDDVKPTLTSGKRESERPVLLDLEDELDLYGKEKTGGR